MGAEALVADRGRFALLRYVADVARDEARNVAVVLVTDSGYRSMRAAPPSSIRGKLREQGILDSLLAQLATRLRDQDVRPESLDDWASIAPGSLRVGMVRTAAVIGSPATTLESLYRALVAPPQRRSSRIGKAEVLDQVVQSFRRRGAVVRRSDYHDNFLFDAIVEDDVVQPLTVEALSFASGARDFSGVERDAGHFLFATHRVSAKSVCVVQPPLDDATGEARKSWHRVESWLKDEAITTVGLDSLDMTVAALVPEVPLDGRQLPLVMA